MSLLGRIHSKFNSKCMCLPLWKIVNLPYEVFCVKNVFSRDHRCFVPSQVLFSGGVSIIAWRHPGVLSVSFFLKSNKALVYEKYYSFWSWFYLPVLEVPRIRHHWIFRQFFNHFLCGQTPELELASCINFTIFQLNMRTVLRAIPFAKC